MKEKRNVIRLLIGRTTSLFGSSMYAIALPLYILHISGSLTQMGIYFAFVNLPSVIISPLLGVFAERHNHKYIVVYCDYLSAAIYLLLYLLLMGNYLKIWMLMIGAILIQVLSSLFEITSNVTFSEINTKENLTSMNGLKSFLDNFASLIAPMLGTILFGTYGFSLILFLTAILYALSATQELWIRYHPITKASSSSTKIKDDIIQGIHYVCHARNILYVFLLVMALNFFIANSEEIINPGILIQKYAISEEIFGFTSTCFVIGTLFAGLFLYRQKRIHLNERLPQLFLLNSFCAVLIGAFSILLYPNQIYYIVFLLLQLLLGCFTTMINVPLFSYFQANVPIEVQSRFFSLLSFSSHLLIPAGIAFAGFLSEHLGADITYIFNNTCIIFIVIFIFFRKKKINF